MEAWRKVWRDGVAPLLTVTQLEVLQRGLKDNDNRLIQGKTTDPPPVMYNHDCPIEAACGLAYCIWMSEDLDTVGDVEEVFARICYDIDQRLGEVSGCRYFLRWFDETPRDEMRRELLKEVKRFLYSIHYGMKSEEARNES